MKIKVLESYNIQVDIQESVADLGVDSRGEERRKSVSKIDKQKKKNQFRRDSI